MMTHFTTANYRRDEQRLTVDKRLAVGDDPDTDLNWVLSASIDGDSPCLKFLGMSCIAIPEDQLEQTQLGSSGIDPQRNSHNRSEGEAW